MTSNKKSNNQCKTTYIVTEDLSLVVCRWCELKGISTNELKESNLFGDLLERLGDALRKCSYDAQPIEVVTLQRSVFDDLLKKRDLVTDDEGQIDSTKIPEKFWVALDNVYPTPLLDKDPAKYNISITRYVNSVGTPFKGGEAHGSRPEDGDENLQHQVRECVNKWEDAKTRYNNKDLPIVLVDDGTFTGETICQVLTEFANQHVIINSVRLGVAKIRGIDLIAGWRPPPLGRRGRRALDFTSGSERKSVLFIGASNVCPPLIDWVCERDFFPGVLYGGKVVAKRDKDGTVRPLRVGEKKIPVRSQYLYGWGNPNEWASIQEDEQRPFTLAALKLSIELWTKLQALWGKTIKVEDLAAVPSKLLHKDEAGMNDELKKPWLEVLQSKHDKLEGSTYD